MAAKKKSKAPEPVRSRQKHLVIRLNETERQLLDAVAKRLGLSMSETIRYLVRRAAEEK